MAVAEETAAAPAEPERAGGSPTSVEAASSGTEQATAQQATRPSQKSATRGAFTVTETGITWTCIRCEASNPLEATACEVCGTPFAEIVKPKDTRPPRDPNTVALVSLFFPGVGHMYLGQWPQGIARAIVHLWVLSVVFISLLAGGQSNTTALTMSFALAATALWAISAHDAYREARSEPGRVILKGKAFLYLVLGLLMLLFLMLVGAGLSARS